MSVRPLSVIVPTRDRPASLRRTLASLAGSRGASNIEVFVIDDGSSPSIAEAFDLCAYPFTVEVVRTAGIGLNAARNLGLEASHSPYVAFLDDDVSVDGGWVEGAISAMSSPHCVAVAGGRTLAAEPAMVPSWISPEKMMYLSVVDLGEKPRKFSATTSPVGANLVFRRSWIDRAGGFREGLDRDDASLMSGGDTDLCNRITDAGGTVLYWPGATVYHHLDPARLTRDWFRRRAAAQGASDALMRYEHRPPSARGLAFELARPLRAVPIAAKRVAHRRPLIDAELWLRSSRGRWRIIRASYELTGPRR